MAEAPRRRFSVDSETSLQGHSQDRDIELITSDYKYNANY